MLLKLVIGYKFTEPTHLIKRKRKEVSTLNPSDHPLLSKIKVSPIFPNLIRPSPSTQHQARSPRFWENEGLAHLDIFQNSRLVPIRKFRIFFFLAFTKQDKSKIQDMSSHMPESKDTELM